ncbi:hypothetical protein VB264_00130 [Arcicella aquatica]|uniref:Uncharacterized protein n=1 Tax=Arcicella aquatica TaxID=217141 RepID=A0ABU5QH69_9BACT|nr:hypothetical protein [Arcicella aquatica]MEA5256169.1 hypothetical protein [Arcicella aquatica]
MVEFKIQLEDTFVQTFGYKEIDKRLQEFVQKYVIKLAAQDILNDLESIDLENDQEWQVSRNLAWQQEEHKYLAQK